MNLIAGKRMDDKEARQALEQMPETLAAVLARQTLAVDTVIRACDKVSRKINEAEHLGIVESLGFSEEKAKRELAMVKETLSADYLNARLARELGTHEELHTPFGQNAAQVTEKRLPLGVLFHIAAGNADALPVYSVIEGLLTGNINLLKLPGGGDDLSVLLAEKLIATEPALADYIHIFATPSEDIDAMKRMASCADAIVLWGSDEAIRAVRAMAEPKTKIIEWGHKVSFAYVSGDVSDEALSDIAWHICDTEQVYCNSCQGIYLDTEDTKELTRFAKRFLRILVTESKRQPRRKDDFLQAQKTLELYTEQLESVHEKKRVFREEDCSVTVYADDTLTASHMYRNCWVKPLPAAQIVTRLFPYKNHLQTVGLVCEEKEKDRLCDLLFRTGVVRITHPRRMSEGYCAMPHDGEYALQRYTKIVSAGFHLHISNL